MEKNEFIDKLKMFLKTISSEAQSRILDDMKRLNKSILCNEHVIHNSSKKNPISRYGTPMRNWLLKEVSSEMKVKISDSIKWDITKNKNKDYLEIRKALKYVLLSTQDFYFKNGDKDFIEVLLAEMNSNQECLFKSSAPLIYKSKYPGSKINVGKRTSSSKKSIDIGFTKEHIIPTKIIFVKLKNSIYENNLEMVFDSIMENNFQVLLNSDDDEKLNKSGLRSKMPNDWKFGDDPFQRYISAGIDISTIVSI